ncbi:putative Taxane 10-beta-hydroxylase [Cocos nucifera]|uniref:Putative Taxane 10-beta-hydroxylase n=1 Tax=Cocos nucifera TaxID=13894 RepID=A0A8K0IV79_COCNU|nr:putative Taxane 10-beta-hydroxylase [Cocos nucifera]
MRANTGEQWLEGRIRKYGPISKLSLFGTPTIFLTGPAANKFVFMNEALVPQQPSSITRILGKRTIIELAGEDHKRVRAAIMQFLKPDVLKNYVGKIDWEVGHHLKMNWIDRQTVMVMPLMKGLTFDIICSLGKFFAYRRQ